MDIKEEIQINAPREIVFSALTDVNVLKKSIPGCESLELLDETKYAATILSKIGPLKIKFKGEANLFDVVEPERYSIIGSGSGGPAGRAKVTAHVSLSEAGDATILMYEVKADLGGKLAQLGGTLIKNTAEKLAKQFFDDFNALIITSNEELNPSSELKVNSKPIPYKLLIMSTLFLALISYFVFS